MTSLYLEQARRVVVDAESAIKSLLSRMTDLGEYDALPPVARIAGELRRINFNISPNPPVASPGAAAPGLAAHPKSLPRPYPDFSRNPAGDRLRMIGWSGKHRGEYKHEAPKVVMKVLVDILIESGAAEGPISMDEILPNIVDPETGTEYPEYHSRTFLRWLREIDVVKKEGHKGYSFAAGIGDDPWATIDAHWNRLPARD